MKPEALRRRIEARLAEQRRLVERLLELRDQLPGSLITRYGRCGKSSCACAEGRGHGPYYVLSNRSGGKGSFTYVGRGRVRETRENVRQYRQFRAGLHKLQSLNEELVALLRSYQARNAELAHETLRRGAASEKTR